MFLEGGAQFSREEVGKMLARIPGVRVLSFQKKRLEGVLGWVMRPRDEVTEVRLQEVARLLNADAAGNAENGRAKQEKKISKRYSLQKRPLIHYHR